MYPSPFIPMTIERAMQCIVAALNSSQSDKDKLRTIQIYSDAWLYGKREPTP